MTQNGSDLIKRNTMIWYYFDVTEYYSEATDNVF